MKNIIYAFIFLPFLFSCNKRQNTISFITPEADSIRLDSLRLDSIFKSRGDTIFASVIYGMNRSEAERAITSFEDALRLEGTNGFIFGGINFMDINLCDYEANKSGSLDPYESSYLWKGKLTSVKWISYNMYSKDLNEIGEEIHQILNIFKTKYGTPTELKTSASDFYIYQGGSIYFMDRAIAKWETDKRLIEIGIHWEDKPQAETESDWYKYKTHVHFIDKERFVEIINYRDSLTVDRKTKERERQRRDSLNSINSL